jgi:hypothetical protein
LEGSGRGLIEVIFQKFPKGTEEKQEKSQLGQMASQAQLKQSTNQIQFWSITGLLDSHIIISVE